MDTTLFGGALQEEVRKTGGRLRREHFFALVLLGVLYALLTVPPLNLDSEAGEVRDGSMVVRVVVPPHSQVPEELSPYGPGLDKELLQAFTQACGYELELVYPATLRKAWKLLEQGKADLLIGSGYEPPAHLRGHLAVGPAYGTHEPVILRGENVRQLYVKGAVGKRWKRFGSSPFLMRANSNLEKRMLAEAPWLGRGEITRINPHYSLKVILESLEGGQASYALVDSGQLRLWRPFFPDLHRERTLSEPIAYRWYWRTGRRDLAVTLHYFWQAQGTKARVKQLKEKYFGFLPEKASRTEITHFLETIVTEMPKYRSRILHETRRFGINPLLYTAMIYQESQFDPRAVSRTGAKGLLQFTTAAASYFGLQDPMNSKESIRAGAEYLKMLWDSLDGLGLSHWDRWCFALAGYNQGKGHLQDAIELTYKLGLKGNSWADLKQALPKLQQKKYAANARYGACRGQEAVQFVDSIRYYYYILRGLISLARPEAEDLGPLVGRRLLAGDPRF